jgi:hypothetical protein
VDDNPGHTPPQDVAMCGVVDVNDLEQEPKLIRGLLGREKGCNSMKKLLVGIIGVLAFGVLAASAFAGNGNTVWLCNGQFITGTGNNRCLIQSENLTELLLGDMNESADVLCPVGSVLNEGWVGPGSEDETTKVEFMSTCSTAGKAENLKGEEVANVCGGTGEAEAVNLPWLTLVYLEGSLTRDIITAGIAGKEPGYKVKCTVAGLKITDECLSGATPVHVELNLLEKEGTEPELVDVLFKETLKQSEWAKCSLGGAESGLVEGEVLLAAVISGSIVPLDLSEE